jgi:hypothetical protein
MWFKNCLPFFIYLLNEPFKPKLQEERILIKGWVERGGCGRPLARTK